MELLFLCLDGSSPCVVAHTFCDDFDHDEAGALWTNTFETAGTIGLDPATWVSPPHSLEVDIPAIADAAPPGPQAALNEVFGFAPTKVSCSFDFQADLEGAGMTAVSWNAYPSAGGVTAYAVRVDVYSNAWAWIEQAAFTDGGSLENIYSTPPTSSAVWRHVDVAITFGASPGFTVAYDGTQVLSQPLTPPAMTGLYLALGCSAGAGVSSERQVHYDNVACDLE